MLVAAATRQNVLVAVAPLPPSAPYRKGANQVLLGFWRGCFRSCLNYNNVNGYRHLSSQPCAPDMAQGLNSYVYTVFMLGLWLAWSVLQHGGRAYQRRSLLALCRLPSRRNHCPTSLFFVALSCVTFASLGNASSINSSRSCESGHTVLLVVGTVGLTFMTFPFLLCCADGTRHHEQQQRRQSSACLGCA